MAASLDVARIERLRIEREQMLQLARELSGITTEFGGFAERYWSRAAGLKQQIDALVYGDPPTEPAPGGVPVAEFCDDEIPW